jgi:acetolactate synthase-1/2/3 large subunit
MTQTIPGSAVRNGVGDTPVTGESIPGGPLVAKALTAECITRTTDK